MTNEKRTKFKTLGEELKKLRLAQGIATQGELAKLLSLAQQTVSRWEDGTSRPRAEQIAVLAKALGADPQQLLVYAGHSKEQVSVSFDLPLPLASLSPEGFQRFTRSLLESLYPGARVHAAGKTGHKQFGIDIEVNMETGERHTFQCKREASFGAAKVKSAVKAHTAKATKKFILLSRVASPLARREVTKHRGWDIWDRDDLSERLRSLSKEKQRRLVDTYFSGQRLALLGEPSPGPWLTPEDFFAPLLSSERPFSHHWELVGRAHERKQLADALGDPAKVVVSLNGPAGGGKSRLLRSAIEDFMNTHPGIRVFMLSPTEQVTVKGLEDLGLDEKLLVVDDAHDRSDRELMERYVADERIRARLFIVFRPYAQEVIDQELAHWGLAGDLITSVAMQKPTKVDAAVLATQVLERMGSPRNPAPHIAEVAYDSPLSVVVGAWIVAKEGLHPELFGSHEVFKAAVLQHYKAAIARGISNSTRDRERIERILRVIALIQPVAPDDSKVLALLQDIEGVSVPDATRLTKLLISSGVLFKRGARYRLSPDLLADSIIETAYITSNGESNGELERVFAAAIQQYKANLLVNLGRLDWRRNEGDTSDSRLLDALWSSLEWEDDYRHVQIKAAAEAAYYQPRQALQFAERLLEGGHGKNEDVCLLIRNAAYNLRYLVRACELLWEVGRSDARRTNQYPSHPLRLLTEMAAPEPRKPIAYCEGIVDFGLSLIPNEASWTDLFTPFDVLKGALATEGHFTSKATSRAITLSAYGVNTKAVRPIRRRIIDAILESLQSDNKRRAFEAAKLLQSAVHGPIGLMNRTPSDTERAEWSAEFVDTLERVNALIETHQFPPVILMRVAQSVSWHAHYPDRATKGPARRILQHLDRDLVTRVTRVLMDGWGHQTWKHDHERRDGNDEVQEGLAKEIKEAFPSAEELACFVNERLLDLKSYSDETLQSASPLVNRLISNQLPLAREVLALKARAAESPLAGFASFALAMLLKQKPGEAYSRIDALLKCGDEDLPLVARAYSMGLNGRSLTEQDHFYLCRIFASSDQSVLASASWIFREVAEQDKQFAIDLLANANPSLTQASRGDLFMWLGDDKLIPLDSISDEQLARILGLFTAPDRLDDHFVRGFLARVAKRNPRQVLELAKQRLERAVEKKDWSMSPIGGTGRHTPSLDVLGHPEGVTLLREALDWALPRAGQYPFAHHFADLVSEVFGFRDRTYATVLEAWSARGTVEHFKVIACVLREAPESFVFAERTFVVRILKSARALGKSVHRDVSSSLCASAVSGLRSGIPGKPFPADLHMKEQAEEVLASLSKADPAYELYDDLRKHAEHGIERSRAEGRAMDDEDADAAEV
ncbi:MAG: transcriptional regulator [Betaproteobacteria bacterium RIFCSPLOWO2_12_FULL_65_14]|nr:MAG: transcriptional regulator [Betaproteobacteria bacterium RIFCSPLOWO2_12_FULL_65_14]